MYHLLLAALLGKDCSEEVDVRAVAAAVAVAAVVVRKMLEVVEVHEGEVASCPGEVHPSSSLEEGHVAEGKIRQEVAVHPSLVEDQDNHLTKKECKQYIHFKVHKCTTTIQLHTV